MNIIIFNTLTVWLIVRKTVTRRVRLFRSWKKHAKLHVIFSTEIYSSDMQLQKAIWILFERFSQICRFRDSITATVNRIYSYLYIIFNTNVYTFVVVIEFFRRTENCLRAGLFSHRTIEIRGEEDLAVSVEDFELLQRAKDIALRITLSNFCSQQRPG